MIIVEDVITTGKSSLECVKLIKKNKAIFVGFACLIDRTNNKKIKNQIVSQVKLKIPTYNKDNVPDQLQKIPITKPGSRFLR